MGSVACCYLKDDGWTAVYAASKEPLDMGMKFAYEDES